MKQRQRKRRLSPVGEPKRRGVELHTLHEAALCYADAELDEDFALANDKLRKAGQRYGIVAFARMGGNAYAKAFNAEQRRAAAERAAKARWTKCAQARIAPVHG